MPYLTREDLEKLGVEEILEKNILNLEDILTQPDELEVCIDQIMDELTNINFEMKK